MQAFVSVFMRFVAFAALLGCGSPGADMVQRYSCLVHALLSHVFAACLLLCWRGVVSRIRSLVVLCVPSLSPPFFFVFFFFVCCSFFFCFLFFVCVLFFFLYSSFFVCVVLFFLYSFFFCIFFLSLFIFVSTELSAAQVWLGCGLGRPVGSSSALGM